MISSALNWFFKKDRVEDSVLKRLNKTNINEAFANSSDEEHTEEPPKPSLEKKAHCVERKGVITKLTTNSGLIDDKFPFGIDQNTVPNLKVGHNVQYLGYVQENGEISIRKIISIQNESWDKNDTQVLEQNNTAEDKAVYDVHMRSICTKVMAKIGRSIVLENIPITCDLDKVKTTFVPETGDIVNVEAVYQTDATEFTLAGEILDVVKIEPQLKDHREGEISAYDIDNNRGVVDKDILFYRDACEIGYNPVKGDRVMTEFIESEQVQFPFRALKVIPLTLKASNLTHENKIEALIKHLLTPKNGISVKPLKFVAKQIGDIDQSFVEITNNGSYKQQIVDAHFRKSVDSQLELVNLKLPRDLNCGQTLKFKLTCTAKHSGYSKELLIFSFRNFKIAKYIDIDVDIDTEITKGSSKKNSMSTMYQNAAKLRSSMINFKTVIPGEQLIKNPSFVHKALGMYYIPDRLYKGVTGKGKQSFDSISQVIVDMEPILKFDVSFETYLPRFRVLLYLEDIDSQLAISQYNMPRAHFTHCQGYLALEIPNLSERRPSLMSGDSLLAIDIEDPQAVKYQGFIHKVQANSIWLKFNPQFHDKYNGKDYILEFHTTRTSIRRCQQAIEMAVENLGRKILFAAQCNLRLPQLDINLDENEDLVLEEKKKEIINTILHERPLCSIENTNDFKSVVKSESVVTKHIEWINKDMNKLQKQTVKNILRGDARPLPYIIFGPPGTGKTITVVETVMQILKLIPNSRILLATPSNSSSNLLTQRLIGLGLKPGEMVRVLAHHLIESGMVPDDIQPYCSTVDLAREGTRESRFKTMDTGLRLHSTRSQLARYRLIISTCMTLGQLHTMGLKRGHFTHVIVDEAGQATEPEIMVPMTHTHVEKGQIILAGDPMQLGPIVGSKFAAHFGLEESYLSRLMLRVPYQKDAEGFKDTGGYNPHLVTKLVNNYRSLPEILKLPSDMFYDSDLEAQKVLKGSNDEKLLNLVADMLPKRDAERGPPPIVFHGIQGKNVQSDDSPSWYNKAEAGQILDFMSKLYAKGIKTDDIGIITPYQKQVQVIRGTLEELHIPVPKIGSVEEFQGQERSIILISTVRSSKSKVVQDLQHTLGFVRNPKRLNVAITRAKTLLVIFGNPSLLSLDNNWNRLITYCISIGGYTGCDLPSTFWNEDELR